MRKLIIVRHGDADGNFLTELGVQEICVLRENLKSFLVDMQIRALVSSAMRAMRSANLLFEGTAIMPRRGTDELFSDDSETYDLESILALVDGISESCDVAVLVTHLEITRDFPPFFAAKRLDVTDWPCKALFRAEAYVIDCEDKTIERVGHK